MRPPLLLLASAGLAGRVPLAHTSGWLRRLFIPACLLPLQTTPSSTCSVPRPLPPSVRRTSLHPSRPHIGRLSSSTLGASASSSAAAGARGASISTAHAHAHAASMHEADAMSAKVQPLDSLDLALQHDPAAFLSAMETEVENSIGLARAPTAKQIAVQQQQQQQQQHKQPLAPSAAANQLRGSQRSNSVLAAAGKNVMGASTAQGAAPTSAVVVTVKKGAAPPAGSMSSRIAAAQQRDENAMVAASKRPVPAAAPSATVARHTASYRSSASGAATVGLAVSRSQNGANNGAAQMVSGATKSAHAAAVVVAAAAIESIPPPSKSQQRASLSPATLTAEILGAEPVAAPAAPSVKDKSVVDAQVDALCAAVDRAELESPREEEPSTLPPPSMDLPVETGSDAPDAADAVAMAASLQRSAWSRSLAPHLTLPAEQSDIRAHLHDREKAHAVHPHYMTLQPELNYRMREILLDWLAGVAYRFRLKPETSMLCASVLDRFLSVRECQREKFQLVGISCLVVAAKYEESLPPSVEDFIIITDRSFTRAQIVHMEGVILSSLGFEMTVPLLASFTGPLLLLLPMDAHVESFKRLAATTASARDLEAELRHWMLYFSLASLQHYQFLSFPTSLTAAAVVALAHFQVVAETHALERAARGADASEEGAQVYWDEALRECSGGYDLADLAEVFADLEEMVHNMSDSDAAAGAAPKYNSVTKRFQRDSFAGVGGRTVAFPKITSA